MVEWELPPELRDEDVKVEVNVSGRWEEVGSVEGHIIPQSSTGVKIYLKVSVFGSTVEPFKGERERGRERRRRGRGREREKERERERGREGERGEDGEGEGEGERERGEEGEGEGEGKGREKHSTVYLSLPFSFLLGTGMVSSPFLSLLRSHPPPQ